jgi:hypothetical protein
MPWGKDISYLAGQIKFSFENWMYDLTVEPYLMKLCNLVYY